MGLRAHRHGLADGRREPARRVGDRAAYAEAGGVPDGRGIRLIPGDLEAAPVARDELVPFKPRVGEGQPRPDLIGATDQRGEVPVGAIGRLLVAVTIKEAEGPFAARNTELEGVLPPEPEVA